MAAILRANASGLGNATAVLTTTPLPPWGNNTNLTMAAEDEFADDLGYSDLQIVFLACVFTAAPLLAVLLSILGVRFVWRKFQGDDLDDELDGMLRRAETHQSMTHEQLKTSESQFTALDGASGDVAVNHKDAISTVSGSIGAAGSGGGAAGAAGLSAPPPHRQTQHNTMSSRSSNGSVITLTMHNNHLIVEKEELVESSQEEHVYATLAAPRLTYSDQKAIVHQPPAVAAAPRQRAETGLSQPDGDSPPYAYGNQLCYDAGPMGYVAYNGYCVDDPPSNRQRQPRPSSSSCRQPPPPLSCQYSVDEQSLQGDPPLPQRLLSDIQAHEHALQHQREHDEAVNGDAKLDDEALAAVLADDGEDDSTSATATEDVCSVKAQSPIPEVAASPPKPLPPLRSPTVDKLRLQDASLLAELEHFPAPAAPETPPPPRSPLALDSRDEPPPPT